MPAASEPVHLAPLDDDAVPYLGMVQPPIRELLLAVWRDTERRLGAGSQKEIHWINLWQRSDPAAALAVDGVDQLSTWSRELAALHYAGEDVEFDGFGFIVNPVGSATQLWHIDYAHDYSTLFVPLTELHRRTPCSTWCCRGPSRRKCWRAPPRIATGSTSRTSSRTRST